MRWGWDCSHPDSRQSASDSTGGTLRWCLSRTAIPRLDGGRLMRTGLRIVFTNGVRQASYTLRSALGRGLHIGLPSLPFAATTPVWG
jgi:hypothetical protein